MTRAAPKVSPPVRDSDQHVLFRDAGWKVYARLLAQRGERPFPKMTYFNGDLELMSPGFVHEDDKTRLARIVEAWADQTGTRLEGFGSWTLKAPALDRGLEPDECYVVGDRRRRKFDVPDIAIEVIKTHGSINKLEVYRGFGIREVWFWKDEALTFWILVRGRYVTASRSRLLPKLDPALVSKCMRSPSQPDALRVLRAALSGKGRKKSSPSR